MLIVIMSVQSCWFKSMACTGSVEDECASILDDCCELQGRSQPSHVMSLMSEDVYAIDVSFHSS